MGIGCCSSTFWLSSWPFPYPPLRFCWQWEPWLALAGLGLPGFIVAVLFAVDSSCYMAALHFTTVAHVVVIMSLTPLFAALAGWIVMREAIRPAVAVAMILSFVGVALMVSGNYASSAWFGDILALGVPTLFAVITVITRRNPNPISCSSAANGSGVTSKAR